MPSSLISKSIKLARLAITSPDTPPLANVWTRGTSQFLIVGEINLPYATAQAVGSAILARIDELWFETPPSLSTTEEIMEHLLGELNKTLANLFAPYTFNPQAPRYHMAVAYFKYPEVCVSTIGNAGAFVISPTRFTNIVKSSVTEDDTSPLFSKKPLFQQIITGMLRSGEALFLTNPSILDYFSVEKLRQVISQFTPGEAAATLDNILKELDRQPVVSLVILKIPNRQELAGVEESVSHLIKTESDTAGILRPKVWGYFKSVVFKLLPAKPSGKKTDVIVPVIPAPAQPSWLVRWRDALTKLGKKIISRRAPWRRSQLKPALVNLFTRGLVKFRQLPKTHRTLVIIAGALLFIFSYSIVSSSKENFVSGLSQNYGQLVQDIQSQQSEIDSALIYNNTTKVAQLLEEVKILLDKFPQRTDSQREQYQTFKQTFNLLSLRILKQVDIPSPDLALDLANLGEHNWQGLLWPDALLTYAGDGLLAGNAGDATAKNLLSLGVNQGGVKTGAAVNNQTALFISNTNSAWVADLTNNVSSVVNRQLPKLLALSPFDGSRLYVLGDSPRTIYRLDINGVDVGSPTVWLSASQGELTGATSLAVDGSIYVLRNGSVIEKYIRGTKRDFTVAPISPGLTAATKIATHAESEYIYILEPSTKRVVVINKDGELMVQLIFSSLNNISDFTVDFDNDELYILSGNRVYQSKISGYIN